MHADEKLSAFVELEREVLTLTFYLASIHAIRAPSRKEVDLPRHAAVASLFLVMLFGLTFRT